MKKGLFHILLLSMLCVVSCHRRPVYPPILYVADSLTNVAPQRALQMLDSIVGEMAEANKPTRMYYQLLTVKAKDKAYIPHTSDSLMLTLVDYYEHGGDKSLLPEAYYYLGSAYRDLNDAPRALDYYQKAIDAMPDEEHLAVKSKVYAQMGDLFTYQDLYSEALTKYKASYQIDLLQNDTIGLLYDLRDIATAHWGAESLDSALYFFEEARQLADKYENNEFSNLITSQIARLQTELGNSLLAKELIQPSLDHINLSNAVSVYSIAAKAYYDLAMYDSASYYYKKLIEYNNVYAQRTGNQYLGKIANIQNRPKEAIDYIDKYHYWNDSIRKISSTESLARMQSLYNYQKAEQEIATLREIHSNNIIAIIVLIFVLLLIIALGAILYLISMRRHDKFQTEIYHHELEEERLRNLIRKSISYKNAKIIDLSENLQKVSLQKNQLSRSEYSNKIRINQNIVLINNLLQEKEAYEQERKEKENSTVALRESLIKQRLDKMIEAKKHMRIEEWDLVGKSLSEIQPNFTTQLLTFTEYGGTEYKISVLTKFGYNTSEMATLISLSISGVSMSRSRLYEKLFSRKGTTEDFNRFILSL